MFRTLLTGAAAIALSSAAFTAAPAAPASTNDVMWFADAYASAYYALDQKTHEVVARIDAGPKGGNPLIVRRTLQDGATERLAIDGAGRNHLRATLVVSRRDGRLLADVTTEVLPDHQASN